MKTTAMLIFGLLGPLLSSCSDGGSSLAVPAAGSVPADLSDLPKDTGGTQVAHAKGTTAATYGHYLYMPSGSAGSTKRYPLIVSLHGMGSSENAGLPAVLNEGPAELIATRKWAPPIPFVVASPQCHTDNGWDAKELHGFIAYLVANAPIDSTRIYLVGVSMGAFGVYKYLTTMGSGSSVAAAVPVAGGGSVSAAGNVSCPVWAFHGAKDASVSPAGDKSMIAAIQKAHPDLGAKITIYSNLDHEWNMWYYTYRYEARTEEPVHDGRTDIDSAFAPYDTDIYRWMLQYRRR